MLDFAPKVNKLPYMGSSVPYSPRIREEFFSETQMATREEKGRGVENPDRKVGLGFV